MNGISKWKVVAVVVGMAALGGAAAAGERLDAWRANHAKVDANGDGNVTASEGVASFKASVPQMKARFAALDVNKDGVLTPDEVPDAKTFKALDKNGDGKVTQAEFLGASAEAVARVFKNNDKNGDGTVTSAEAAQNLQEKIRAKAK